MFLVYRSNLSKIKRCTKYYTWIYRRSFKNPTYEEICKGTSGHTEAIKCDFDDKIISLELILEIFFVAHDPTQKNRQGNDIGTQYRSAIFYTNLEQKKKAEEAIKKAEKIYQNIIQTELSDKLNFFVAEEYHHNYFLKKIQ